MGLTIRTNTPFASLMTSAIPGAKYVYVKPIAPSPSQRTSNAVSSYSSYTAPAYSPVRTSSYASPISPATPSLSAPPEPTTVTKYSWGQVDNDKVGDFIKTLQDWNILAENGEQTKAFDLSGGVSGGTSGGGGDWIAQLLGIGNQDNFAEEIKEIFGMLPSQTSNGEDTFMSDIQALLSPLNQVTAAGSVEGGGGDSQFLTDIKALMPTFPQEGVAGKESDFMEEMAGLMSSLPVSDYQEPSNALTSDFYDYYYYYNADSYLNDYY